MFIKRLNIDCFKTFYNQKLTGFNPNTTAITGLRNTGKSTIVESICFVLGIINMSSSNTGDPEEFPLNTCANATVSITFDTSQQKSQAPPGFRKDEITITRNQSLNLNDTYMIDGVTATKKIVRNFFRSMKLDEPHFVVMQGQVDKVRTMQPSEILSLIKAAAGINSEELDNLKRQKMTKENNIRILKTKIAQDVPRLELERPLYEEFEIISDDISTTKRLKNAFKYKLIKDKRLQIAEEIMNTEIEVPPVTGSIDYNNRICDAIEKELQILKKWKGQRSKIHEKLKKKLSALYSREHTLIMDLRVADACVADNATQLQRYLQQKQAELQAKRARAAQEADPESSAAALKAAYHRFQSVCSDLEDNLRQRWKAPSEAESRVSCAALDLETYEAKLLKLRAGYEPAYAHDQAALANCERRRQELQSKVQNIAARHAALPAERRALEEEVRAQRAAVDVLTARLQRCDFRYDLPQPDFDCSRVHGTIAHLIEKSNPTYYTSLETVAGDKLYSVVVDTMQTASLLRKCGMRTRLIPLDTIRGTAINAKTIAAAQEIGGGVEAVQLALSLVPNVAALAPALRWVFGKTLVCRDLNTALLVYNHPRVRCRCVTLDGDVCDLIDGGTVTSGGAGSRGPSTLQQLAELRAAEDALHHHQRRLAAVDARDALLKRNKKNYEKHKKRLDNELQRLTERLTSSRYTKVQAEIERLEAQVSEKRSALERERAAQQVEVARAAQLEKTDQRYQEILREYENAKATLLNANQVDVNENGTAWRECTNERQVEARRGALKVADALASAVARRDRKFVARQNIIPKVQKSQCRVTRQAVKMTEIIRKVDMREKRMEILRVATRLAEIQLEGLNSRLKKLRIDARTEKDAMAALLLAEPWILAESRSFGEPLGEFDFVMNDAAGAEVRLADLRRQFFVLTRRFNTTAYLRYARKEARHDNLVHRMRKKQVELKKLVDEMESLNVRTHFVLRSALNHINHNLWVIYSHLLPGANAILKPRPGSTVEEGLVISVRNDGSRTDSMEMLSIGQQRQVALALRLAVMLYRPAPLYILDAVDTTSLLCQNLDVVLRDHFPQSQFIIVSRSDELCSYANVLFRLDYERYGKQIAERTVNAVVPDINMRARERQEQLKQDRAGWAREREASDRRRAREQARERARERARDREEREREDQERIARELERARLARARERARLARERARERQERALNRRQQATPDLGRLARKRARVRRDRLVHERVRLPRERARLRRELAKQERARVARRLARDRLQRARLARERARQARQRGRRGAQ